MIESPRYAPLLVVAGIFIATTALCGGMAAALVDWNIGAYVAATVAVLLTIYLVTCFVGWAATRRKAEHNSNDVDM